MEWAIVGLVMVALVMGAAGWSKLSGRDRVRQRLDRWSGASEPGLAGEAVAPAPWRWLVRGTRPLRRLSEPQRTADAPGEGAGAPSEEVSEGIALRFQQAGIRHPQAVAAFFGLKALLSLALPVVGLAALTMGGAPLRGVAAPGALLLLSAGGYYAPNVWLARRIRQRQRLIFEAFPDALDLMTVCVEAGLGTEAALLRVAQDLALQSPDLADELRLVNLELRAGAGREAALRHLAQRTGVEEVDAFVTLLLQAERFGTPMAQALRVHAQALRTLRRQRAEEAAAQIALKLLFPLIFCIFPSLMVVLMGPAMLQIHRVLLPSMAGGS